MNFGQTIFSQLMDFIPAYDFNQCVKRYNGNYKIKNFTCWEQFLCMAFAQLTYRESLRDIQACLRAANKKLYHMGIRSKVSLNTLANANQIRDWRIYADFAQILISEARKLYADEDFGVHLEQTVYALDSTTIDLCLSLFPWALFRKKKGAVKLHTLIDLRGNIPTVFFITHGKVHALTIAEIYRCRWQVELFFKWIKQHLRIKAFYGTSENAVKTQIWIAISVYVLVAIVKKRLNLNLSLYTILQILSVSLFEKTPILQALTSTDYNDHEDDFRRQLILFD